MRRILEIRATWLLIPILIVLTLETFTGPSLFAQEAGPVATLTKQYEEAKSRALAPFDEERTTIENTYLAKLSALEKEYTAKGALEPVLELQKEREVFEKSRETGGGQLDDLKVIRNMFQREVDASAAKSARLTTELDDIFRQRLERIQVEQTKAGNIGEAKAAKTMLDELASGSKSTILAAPSAGTKRAPWSAPAPADESVWEGGTFLDPITLPAGTHRLRNKITIGVRQPAPRFNDVYLLEGTKVSCAESGEIFLTLGKGNAFGVVFDSAYVTGGLDADWHFINCAFDHTRLAKGDGWASRQQASRWKFENCRIKGSFFPKWNTQDVGYDVESTTFEDVNFADLDYRSEAGALAQSETLRMKACHFQSCDIPLSVLITTRDCVFERCTFRDDADGFSITSSVSVTIFASGSSNRIQNLPSKVKLEIRDLKEYRGKYGASER